MRITAAICAHPERESYARELSARLDREVPIVFDSNPVPSRDPMQRWLTHRRAWLAAVEADPNADGALVLQDDVQVPRDLIAGLEKVLEQLPADRFIVSAYSGINRRSNLALRKAHRLADLKGHTLYRGSSLIWGPAVLAPVWSVPEMVESVEDHISRHAGVQANTDYAIGLHYRRALRVPTTYTLPSLVQHRGLPSLVGHDRDPKRQALKFLGEGKSALDVDWTRHALS